MTDFDDSPPTLPEEAVPLELSDGFDSSDAVTPVVRMLCRECRALLMLVDAEWPPPANADDAWHSWNTCCVANAGWSWCVRTGVCWKRGARFDYERRKPRESVPQPWMGEERRGSGRVR